MIAFCVLIFAMIIYLVLSYMIFRYIMKPRNKNFFGERCAFAQFSSEFIKRCNIKEVAISSFDKTVLNAIFIENITSDKMIIIIHGYGSSSKNMTLYAQFFFENGYTVLIPDLRGHGKSGGKYSGLSVLDADDLKKWLEKFENYNIALFGLSMGGLTALRMLTKYPDVKVKYCITDSSPYSMKLIIKKVFNWKSPIGWKWFELPFNLYLKIILGINEEDSIKDNLEKLKVPVLLIHGKKDGLVPYFMCMDMYDNIKSEKKIVLFENSDHTQSVNNDDYWIKISEFIE